MHITAQPEIHAASAPETKTAAPRQEAAWLAVSAPLRAAAALLLWGLLAGYLIFNKPFAQLGVHPIYVGEMVLAVALLALLARWRTVFLEPLRRSLPLRLIAAFWVYGVLRALYDFPAHGWWALRDSVLTGYGLLAFVAPALWGELVPRRDAARLPAHVVAALMPLSLLAAGWSLCLQFGWADIEQWLDTKADFMTLAAAVAAWVWAIAAVKVRRGASTAAPADSETRRIAFLGSAALAVLAFELMRHLPTRTIWLSAGPLAALTLAALAYTRGRKIALGAACGMALLGAAVVMGGLLRSFQRFEKEYELNEHLNFSIGELERELRAHPEHFEALVLRGVTTGDAQATRERLQSLFSTNELEFQTRQGQLGAHAIKWRAIFWTRCFNYTLDHAPVFGSGFGVNLTYMLRNTPAWPIYIDSVRVTPPNRSPHSAHVSIFARLGLLGLALWAAILATVFRGALKTCWHHGALAADPAAPAEAAALHRARFWDFLAVFGIWIIYLWAMTFGVVLEGPFGGMWFWALTGVLVQSSRFKVCSKLNFEL